MATKTSRKTSHKASAGKGRKAARPASKKSHKKTAKPKGKAQAMKAKPSAHAVPKAVPKAAPKAVPKIAGAHVAPRAVNVHAVPKAVPKAQAKKKPSFSPGDFVVYPTHGVGKVTSIEVQEIAGHKLRLFVISFDRDRMTLRVPITKVDTSGLRKLSSRKMMDVAMETLKGRARVKRTMWSRRAQEYEAKINSGDPISIAEVVRDLHRNVGQPDQSFSERQIYESARDRLAYELAAVERIDVLVATEKLEELLKAA